MKFNRSLFYIIFIQYAPIIVSIIVWEFFSFFFGSNYFPHISDTLSLMVRSLLHDKKIEFQGIGSDGFSSHLIETISYYCSGCIVGIFLGISMSIFLFYKTTIRRIIEPLLEFIRIIPPLIIAPFLLLAFRDNPMAKFFIVAFYTTLSINIYALNAIDQINKNYLGIVKLFKINKRRTIKDILVPAILPEIIGGIRINIAMSMGVLIVGENIGSFNGIGKILSVITQFNDATYIFVCIIWSVFIILIFDMLVFFILKKVFNFKLLSL